MDIRTDNQECHGIAKHVAQKWVLDLLGYCVGGWSYAQLHHSHGEPGLTNEC